MQTNTKILLAEDDPLQAESIAALARGCLPDADVRWYGSEHAFLLEVESGTLAQWNPNFAIIDLRIRYYALQELRGVATPNFESLGKAAGAGVRCRDALAKICPNTKTAILTVMEDNPGGCVIKKGDGDYKEELAAFLKCRS